MVNDAKYECSAPDCTAPTDDHYCTPCHERLHATCTRCLDVALIEEMKDGVCKSCDEYDGTDSSYADLPNVVVDGVWRY